MIHFLQWYLIVVVVGLLAFPLSFRVLSRLPDRGWSISKPFGLLFVGYIFWILTTLQINQNSIGGILVGLVVLAAISVWQGFREGWRNIWTWIQQHRGSLIVTEILFLVAFGFWAMVRATYPYISGTEKPMEMAFINAIIRSPTFPPADPWLSGYSISYYYFGYVIVSMLVRLAGTSPNIGFNLAVALWFALAAVASYGILFNLTRGWLERTGRNIRQAVWSSFLGPFLLLIISNLEGLFEILHARGLFWTYLPDGTATSKFWQWLGLLELIDPPSQPLGWSPTRVGGIWWWRASRVVTDKNLAGSITENIDEFPFFSFYLGDLHPHVLALPFALLCIGFILNFFLSNGKSLLPGRSIGAWLRHPGFWLGSIIIGSLSFLNTWDFPIYVAMLAACYTMIRYRMDGWGWERVWDFLKVAIIFGVTGVVLYLPFFLGFRSQAGGILPSLSLFSRGIYFWIMFGGMLVPILGWLTWGWRKQGRRTQLRNGIIGASWILIGLFVVSYFLGLLLVAAPSFIDTTQTLTPATQKLLERAGQFYNLHGSSDPQELIIGSLVNRLKQPGTWITLFGLVVFTWGLLSARQKLDVDEDITESRPTDDRIEESFNLILVLVGIGLTLAPEFIYLLDQFGYRMNTIFKFYYQAWLVWSIAAGFALVVMWNQRGKTGFLVFKIISALLIGIGLIYPVAALLERFERPMEEWTLDGLVAVRTYNPDEMLAIEWLRTAEVGVVAEAIGGQYSDYARIASHTGLPNVLGWPGHESQWGRTAEQLGTRVMDIERLYGSMSWEEAKFILDQYQIRYVYIGDLERAKYQIEESKFENVLRVAFQSGRVIIYEYSSSITSPK